MSTPASSITVNGVDYVPADQAPTQGDLSIVILQRGRVLIGNLTLDGDYGTLTSGTTSTEPVLGRSMAAISLSRVLLPAPGPPKR